jgi:patatin-like phospholipase/acyl hydrolase
MSKFKILSLDGGGSWALIQIRILQKIYGKDKNGHDVLKEFDMVIANSGGSLALAAMANGNTLEEIADIFKNDEKRNSVFSKLGWLEDLQSKILNFIKVGPKYSASRKLIALKKILNNLVVKDITDIPTFIGKKDLQIIVCAFDYERRRATFFRSNKDSLTETINLEKKWGIATNGKFKSCTLVEAVHAASNAPINYFNEPAKFKIRSNTTLESFERYYWDGAVGGNNNPVHIAVIEAISNGIKTDDIEILSIGTANTMLPIDPTNQLNAEYPFLVIKREKQAFKNDLLKMTTSILSDPPDFASFVAYSMLNPTFEKSKKIKFVRLNPLIQPSYNDILNRWGNTQRVNRKRNEEIN